ncbi:caspase family protein [Arthrobacter sp.]|uniref:caspase family protein n=1 Tax=Arthrobacter sp. TaxID=1667 RepID=UPI003A8CD0A8
MTLLSLAAPEGATGTDRDLPPTADALQALRPHLVNLSDGRFSTGGQLTTGPQDVDRIFDAYLPAFVQAQGGHDVPLVIYAHGGLVSEAAGLAGAARLCPWWLDNGVYPLFFIWETGLWDALRSLLGGGPRDLSVPRGWLEDGANRIIEVASRPLGEKVWGQMKIGAAHAVASDGGAAYVAARLARFTREHPGAVRIHAVGHSAGSIFHSRFLPAYLDAGGQHVASLDLLAPAVTTADFSDRLLPRIGAGREIESFTLFGMTRQTEEDDNVVGIYRRSLLCLVRAGFEDEPNTPLLGLQESVQADPKLSALVAGHDGAAIWSPTSGAPPTASSGATSHGAFDDDPSTLGSVMRRVLGRSTIIEYGPSRPLPPDPSSAAALPADPSPVAPAPPAHPEPTGAPGAGASSAGRLALCVGLNEFAHLPQSNWLNGCVNDAEEFAALLASGFRFADSDITVLVNAEATRSEVMGRLQDATARLRSGELEQLVFTFSSHGTQVPDDNQDEEDQMDEAFVTYDMNRNGDQWDPSTLMVDDDLQHLFDDLPPGARVDVVLDTCHSGSGLRAMDLLPGRTPRFVPPPTAAGLEVATAARSRTAGDLFKTSSAGRGPVLFAACRSDQTAADAHINGRYNGAFSRYLIDGLTSGAHRSRSDLLAAVRSDLQAGRFNQEAQLEGSSSALGSAWGAPY